MPLPYRVDDIHQLFRDGVPSCEFSTVTEQRQHRKTFNILLLFSLAFLDIAGSAQFWSNIYPSCHFALCNLA